MNSVDRFTCAASACFALFVCIRPGEAQPQLLSVQPGSAWTIWNPPPRGSCSTLGNPQIPGVSDVVATPLGAGVRCDAVGTTSGCCECAYAERTFPLDRVRRAGDTEIVFHYETASQGAYSTTAYSISLLLSIGSDGNDNLIYAPQATRTFLGAVGDNGIVGCRSEETSPRGQVRIRLAKFAAPDVSFNAVLFRFRHYGCEVTNYQTISDILVNDLPPSAGTVNAGNVTPGSALADVLLVNGAAGTGGVREISVPVATTIEVACGAAPLGPASGTYALWVWPGTRTGEFGLRFGGSLAGFTVGPTPFEPFTVPQATRCLRGGLPATFCAGLREVATSPPSVPFSVRRRSGFGRPLVFTLQGLVQDSGADTPLGMSVTNAVVLRIE